VCVHRTVYIVERGIIVPSVWTPERNNQRPLARLGSGRVRWCYTNRLLCASRMNWVHAEGQSLFYPAVPLHSSGATMRRCPKIRFPRCRGQPGTRCVWSCKRAPVCAHLSVCSAAFKIQRGGNKTITPFKKMLPWEFKWLEKLWGKERKDPSGGYCENPKRQRRCENAAEEVAPDKKERKRKSGSLCVVFQTYTL